VVSLPALVRRRIFARHPTVLIDPTGKITYHWAKVKAAGHADAVREKLIELRQSPVC
jgi:peroxiredoxin